MRIGRDSGHIVEKHRAKSLSKRFAANEWTRAELRLAENLILTDPKLTKQISYERTVGPGVFAIAKDRPEVRAGRLHTRRAAAAFCREQDANDAHALLSDLFEAVDLVKPDGERELMWAMQDLPDFIDLKKAS